MTVQIFYTDFDYVISAFVEMTKSGLIAVSSALGIAVESPQRPFGSEDL